MCRRPSSSLKPVRATGASRIQSPSPRPLTNGPPLFLVLPSQPGYELFKEKGHCPMYLVISHHTRHSVRTTRGTQEAAAEQPGWKPLKAGLPFSPLPAAPASQSIPHTAASKARTTCSPAAPVCPFPTVPCSGQASHATVPPTHKAQGTLLPQGLHTGCSLHPELSSPRQTSHLTFFKSLRIVEPLNTSLNCNPFLFLCLFH